MASKGASTKRGAVGSTGGRIFDEVWASDRRTGDIEIVGRGDIEIQGNREHQNKKDSKQWAPVNKPPFLQKAPPIRPINHQSLTSP